MKNISRRLDRLEDKTDTKPRIVTFCDLRPELERDSQINQQVEEVLKNKGLPDTEENRKLVTVITFAIKCKEPE